MNGLVEEGNPRERKEVMVTSWDVKEIMASPQLKSSAAAFALQEIKAFRQEIHQGLRLTRRT